MHIANPPPFYSSNLNYCMGCGKPLYDTSHDTYCSQCSMILPMQPFGIEMNGCYPVDLNAEMKVLEDKVETLEEALEESEAELSYTKAQLELALELALKAHELREKVDALQPYKDQPYLPFGDFPQ